MPPSLHTPPSPAEIQALVAEVIRRLRAGAPAPSAGPATVAPAAVPATLPAGVELAERVIALASVERLPAGTGRIVIGPTALLTPSARERLAELRIAVERRSARAAAPAAARPFSIARVDCPADAAARIARALPTAQQLPATGMADVVQTLSVQASRDAALGLMLTGRPALALVLANRSRSLRAVTGRDASAVLAAAREAAANLLVVNPRDWSAGALERVAVEFARLDVPLPAEFAAAAEGCGCKGH